MALKRKITKAEYDALSDVLKAEYKAHGDGYVLDTDDAAELSNALERQKELARQEKERADRLERERQEADTARQAAELEAAKKRGDIEALERSWQAKVDAEKAKADEAANALREKLKRLLVVDKAREIAVEISTAPELILPHIERRLMADLDGDDPVTRVLDATGKPSASTVDELKQEFIANDKFAAIIIGSKANGGNAGQTRGGGNATGKKISEMTEAERVALHRQIGATEFARRAEAERSGVAA